MCNSKHFPHRFQWSQPSLDSLKISLRTPPLNSLPVQNTKMRCTNRKVCFIQRSLRNVIGKRRNHHWWTCDVLPICARRHETDKQQVSDTCIICQRYNIIGLKVGFSVILTIVHYSDLKWNGYKPINFFVIFFLHYENEDIYISMKAKGGKCIQSCPRYCFHKTSDRPKCSPQKREPTNTLHLHVIWLDYKTKTKLKWCSHSTWFTDWEWTCYISIEL